MRKNVRKTGASAAAICRLQESMVFARHPGGGRAQGSKGHKRREILVALKSHLPPVHLTWRSLPRTSTFALKP